MGLSKKKIAERDTIILDLRKSGVSVLRLSKLFPLTVGRIYQILSKKGFNGSR